MENEITTEFILNNDGDSLCNIYQRMIYNFFPFFMKCSQSIHVLVPGRQTKILRLHDDDAPNILNHHTITNPQSVRFLLLLPTSIVNQINLLSN